MTEIEKPTIRLQIDELDLVGELKGQPQQQGKWERYLAEHRDVLERAESALELLAAKLSLKVRKTPSRFGLDDKPGNESVKAVVIIQKEYQTQTEVVLDAKKRVGVIWSAVGALKSRDRALESIKDLYVHEYYLSKRQSDGE